MERMDAIVSGTVQGVGFRYFALREAELIGGISGYARNMPSGQVEVVAEGNREQLEKLLDALGRGPSFSEVTGIDVKWTSVKNPGHSGFTIKR